MMKRIILLALCVFMLPGAFATKHSVYFELGGNAAFYSVNYERNYDHDWGLRLGLGGFGSSGDGHVIIPILFNKYWGSANSNHRFETGLGASYAFIKKKRHFLDFNEKGNKRNVIVGTASLGYRYIPKSKGMTFKVAFTPIFNEEKIVPWLGISVGHAF